MSFLSTKQVEALMAIGAAHPLPFVSGAYVASGVFLARVVADVTIGGAP